MDDWWVCFECDWYNPYTDRCDWDEWRHEPGDVKRCQAGGGEGTDKVPLYDGPVDGRAIIL